MEIGDTLVFIGENIVDSHFSNFEYGKKYTIINSMMLPNDGDQLETYRVFFFDNHKYGCLEIYLDKYFVTLKDFRNNKIKNII